MAGTDAPLSYDENEQRNVKKKKPISNLGVGRR
jgi:hypothetical protein